MSLHEQLWSYLERYKCPLSGKEFLPLGILEEKITSDIVKKELCGDGWEKQLTLLRYPSLPQKVSQDAKKVFAILVLIGNPWAIKRLIREGLTDRHLPLRQGGSGFLESSDNTTFKSPGAWGTDATVKLFIDKQWLVLAPVLDSTGQDIKLSDKCKCALPICDANHRAIDGFSSKVRKGIIPAGHQKGFKVEGTSLDIAIKEITDKDIFLLEKKNLNDIRRLQHRHLIKHIATCQIRDGYCYAILFPWASGGNLSNFWTHKDSTERAPDLFLWCFQQLLGLVDALKALHSINCRHGDLKPENILYFKEGDYLDIGGEGVLVIADVGVSKVHVDRTVSRPMGTNTHATTPSYEAPEAQFDKDAARARRYDMWSIGCIFLEFAIWLLYDLDAIKNFRKWREESRCDPITPKASFYDRPTEGIVDVQPAVRKMMYQLRNNSRCQNGTALGDFLDLIENDLLLVEVSRRCHAAELYNKLKKIVQDAEENASYLLNDADSHPPTPLIFVD
ncbi:kinase-like protein [Hyaloscypha bicolor E]|uniref:Kinase-like protein n=1 Tax=Hyaloscypha bicolor E TaxID=1095630 RepID=A0A2J6T6I9_9HELO|nr:kinase-like protein [Hyaloscypha bicolor E]PMD58640.1 kinase-like protein [Hyaloscypha bicolor E]